MLLPLFPLAGQEVVVSVSIRDGVTRGDEHFAALRADSALESYRGTLVSEPDRFDALWRAARAAVSVGMLEPDDDRSAEWYDLALDFADRAVSVEPDSAAGWEWRAIATGQKALAVGPSRRVELSEQVRNYALRTLELDPEAAGAHHVLGQWHAEIQRLGGLTRFAAERLLGAATFREASWTEALRHLERAVELEPRAPIHRLALARILVDRERPAEAIRQLRTGATLAPAEPTDPGHLEEIRDLLADLESGSR